MGNKMLGIFVGVGGSGTHMFCSGQKSGGSRQEQEHEKTVPLRAPVPSFMEQLLQSA